MKSPRPAGVSLIITLIFISAFMLILADMYAVGLNMIRMNTNWEANDKAENLSESAQEIAVLIAGNIENGTPLNGTQIREWQERLYAMGRGFGETTCGLASGGTSPSSGVVNECAKFEVITETAADAKLAFVSGETPSYFSAPVAVKDGTVLRGTGTAKKNCENDYDTTEDSNYPCHWNKLLLGESVEIPLATKSSGNDFGAAYSEFKLRVRTPECEMNPVSGYPIDEQRPACDQAADDKYRFVLYPRWMEGAGSAYRDIQKDKVLVQWSITGEEANGRSVTMVAAKEKSSDPAEPNKRNNSSIGLNPNTEITAGRINKFNNSADGFSVLEANHLGEKISLAPVPELPRIADFIKTVKNPTLRLTLVTRPSKSFSAAANETITNDTKYNVPFLEYQLLTKCSGTCNPTKDSKYIIMGKATIGEYTKYFTKYINRRTTLGGFVLENF